MDRYQKNIVLRRIVAFLLAVVLIITSVWFDIPSTTVTAQAETTTETAQESSTVASESESESQNNEASNEDDNKNEAESTETTITEANTEAKETEPQSSGDSAENEGSTTQESIKESEKNSEDTSEKTPETGDMTSTTKGETEEGTSAPSENTGDNKDSQENDKKDNEEEKPVKPETQKVRVEISKDSSSKVSEKDGKLNLTGVSYGDSVTLTVKSKTAIKVTAYKEEKDDEGETQKKNIKKDVLEVKTGEFSEKDGSTEVTLTFNQVIKLENDIYLEITAEESEDYQSAELTLTIPEGASIGKKTLTLSDDLEVATSKVYDGTTDIEIKKAPSLNGIVGSDDVKLTVSAKVEDASVGQNKEVKVDFALGGDDKDNYTLSDSTKIGKLTTEITKRQVDVTVPSVDIAYNEQQVEDAIKACDTEKFRKEISVENADKGNSGLLESDKDLAAGIQELIQEYLASGEHFTADDIKKVNTLQLEIYAVGVDWTKLDLGDDYKNYQIQINSSEDEDASGKIEVEVTDKHEKIASEDLDEQGNATNISDLLDLSAAVKTGENYYFKKGEDYSINVGKNISAYNAVYTVKADGKPSEKWSPNTQKEGQVTDTLCLVELNGDKEVAYTSSFKFTYLVDETAPMVEFTPTTPETLVPIAGKLVELKDVIPSFTSAVNGASVTSVTKKISVYDPDIAGTGLVGSGVNSETGYKPTYAWVSYNPTEDSTDALVKAIEVASFDKEISDGSLVSLSDVSKTSGNYILVVHVYDNVGNDAYVCDNGVIFDTAEPEITVADLTGSNSQKETVKKSFNKELTETDKNGDSNEDYFPYYAYDTQSFALSVTAKEKASEDKDNPAIVSGIASISYTLKDETGNILRETTEDTNYTEIYNNETRLTKLTDIRNQKLTNTWDQLKALPTKDGNIQAGSYELTVTATDYAGNATSETVTFIVAEQAAVSTTLQDADKYNSNDSYYYAKKPTIEAEITTDCLDSVSLTLDKETDPGKTESKTYTLKNGKLVYDENENGVEIKAVDSNVASYSWDAETKTLTVTFTGDAVYQKIQVSCKDETGRADNGNGTLDKGLVVDNTSPTITMKTSNSYQSIGGKNYVFYQSDGEETVVPSVQVDIKERFLDVDTLTVTVQKENTKYECSLGKNNGTSVLAYEENGKTKYLDDITWKWETSYSYEKALETGSYTSTLELAFNGEESKSVYYNSISVSCADSAKNTGKSSGIQKVSSEKETVDIAGIIVDKANPTITMKASTPSGYQNISGGNYAFYNADASVSVNIQERFLNNVSIDVTEEDVTYRYKWTANEDGKLDVKVYQVGESNKKIELPNGVTDIQVGWKSAYDFETALNGKDKTQKKDNATQYDEYSQTITFTFAGKNDASVRYHDIKVTCNDYATNSDSKSSASDMTTDITENGENSTVTVNEIIVDKLAPSITMTATEPTQIQTVNKQNYAFYKSDNTAKVSVNIKERFLNNVSIDVTKEDVKYRYEWTADENGKLDVKVYQVDKSNKKTELPNGVTDIQVGWKDKLEYAFATALNGRDETQKEDNATEYDNYNKTITFIFTGSEDGQDGSVRYSDIRVTCNDYAANLSNKSSDGNNMTTATTKNDENSIVTVNEIIVDKLAPSITMTATKPTQIQTVNEQNYAFYNAEASLEVNIQERFLNNVSIDVTKEDVTYRYKWEAKNGSFSEPAVYKVTSDEGKETETLLTGGDKPSDITVTALGYDFATALNGKDSPQTEDGKIKYDNYNKTITFTFAGEEKSSVRYHDIKVTCNDYATNSDSKSSASDMTTAITENGKESTVTVNEIIVDKLAPSITMTATGTEQTQTVGNQNYAFYNAEASVKVNIQERFLKNVSIDVTKEGVTYRYKWEAENGSFSEPAVYKVTSDEGKETETLLPDKDNDKPSDITVTGLEYAFGTALNGGDDTQKKDNATQYDEYSKTITFTFAGKDEASVRYHDIKVTCEDYSTNSTDYAKTTINNESSTVTDIVVDKKSVQITADASKPQQIKNKIDGESSTDGKDYISDNGDGNEYFYYNADAIVTATFTERYLNKNTVELNFTDESGKSVRLKLTKLQNADNTSSIIEDYKADYGIVYQWNPFTPGTGNGDVTDSESNKDSNTSTLKIMFKSIEIEEGTGKFKSTVYRNIVIKGTDMANNNSASSEGNTTVDKKTDGLNIVVNKNESYNAIVDKVAPKVTLTLPNDQKGTDDKTKSSSTDKTKFRYYNDTVTLTGTIQERYLDVSSVRVNLNDNSGEKSEVKSYSIVENEDESLSLQDSNGNKLSGVTFEWTTPYEEDPVSDADGTSKSQTDDTITRFKITFNGVLNENKGTSQIYTDISVSCADTSWNSGTSEPIDDFTVDLLDPKVVLKSSTAAGHNTYYNSSAVVTATITERFLDVNTLRVNVTREGSKKSYTLNELLKLDNITIEWNDGAYLDTNCLTNNYSYVSTNGTSSQNGDKSLTSLNVNEDVAGDGTQNTLVLTFNGKENESIYYDSITVTVADKAARSTTSDALSFVVDQKNPEITMTASTATQYQTVDKLNYGFYSGNATVTVAVKERFIDTLSVNLTDEGTVYTYTWKADENGKLSLQVYTGSQKVKEPSDITWKWTSEYSFNSALTGTKRDDYTSTLVFTFKGKDAQSVRYYSMSANCKDYATNKGGSSTVQKSAKDTTQISEVIVDKLAPKISMTASSAKQYQTISGSNYAFYSGNSTVTINVTERFLNTVSVNVNREGTVYKYVWAPNSTNDNKTLKLTVYDKKGNLVEDADIPTDIQAKWKTDSSYKFADALTGTDKDNYTSTLVFTFKGKDAQSVRYYGIKVTGNDYAKRSDETSLITNSDKSELTNFIVDRKAPVITSQTITKASKNKQYYKKGETPTVTIKIQERYLDKETLRIHIKVNKDEEQAYSLTDKAELPNGIKLKTSIPSSKSATDETISTLTLTFPKDGDYTVWVSCNDMSLNTRTYDKSIENKKELSYTQNKKTTKIQKFIVDTKAPQVKVSFSDADQSSKAASITRGKSRVWDSTASITAAIQVTDRNLSPNQNDVQSSFEMVNANGEAIGKPSSFVSQLRTASNWKISRKDSHDESINTTKLTFTKEANYTWDKLVVEDMAGNKCTYVNGAKQSYQFTIDRTAPTGSITYSKMNSAGGKQNAETKTWSTTNNSKSNKGNSHTPTWYDWYSKRSVEVNYTKTDEISSQVTCEYYISYQNLGSAALPKSISNWRKIGSTAQNVSPVNLVTIPVNRYAIAYMKLTDKAGNTSYYNADGLITDNKQATVSFSYPEDKGFGYYNSDVTVTAHVVDTASDGTYSGIKSITSVVINNETGHRQTGSSRTFSAKSHQQSVDMPITIYSANNNSDNVVVEVTVTDYAGNTFTQKSKVLKIDITKPEVSISYGKQTAQNKTYYKDGRTAIITVKDRHFDDKSPYQLTMLKDKTYTMSGWSHSGNIHTATITFSKDGDYQFTINATDSALNKSETKTSEAFTVDKTVPKIGVTYNDDKSKTNGTYFQDSRTAYVTITEHNYDPSAVKISITKQQEEGKATENVPYTWSPVSSGDEKKGTISLKEEGIYNITISCTDSAGNVSETYKADTFTIDTQDPEVKIEGVQNQMGYTDATITPVITCTDTNYVDDGKTGVDIQLTYRPYDANNINTALQKYETNYTATKLTTNNGYTYRYANIQDDITHDGYYKLTVQVTDKAGRKSKLQTVEFTVNRYGSYYEADADTLKIIDTNISEAQDLVIIERNIDTIQNRKVTYTLNGEAPVTLEEGTGYKVELVNDKADQWKEYRYTIFKENFETQGKYTITLYSENVYQNKTSAQTTTSDGQTQTTTDSNQTTTDSNQTATSSSQTIANNSQTQTTTLKNTNNKEKPKAQEISFILDTEDPKAQILDLETDRYNAQSHTFRVYCSDNNGDLQSLQIKVNGEPQHTFNADALREAHNEVSWTLEASDSRQQVEVTVTDMAGRKKTFTLEDYPDGVLVTTNKWIQFVNNKPLFYGSLAVVGIILLALAVFFFMKYRKKRAEQAGQDENEE